MRSTLTSGAHTDMQLSVIGGERVNSASDACFIGPGHEVKAITTDRKVAGAATSKVPIFDSARSQDGARGLATTLTWKIVAASVLARLQSAMHGLRLMVTTAVDGIGSAVLFAAQLACYRRHSRVVSVVNGGETPVALTAARTTSGYRLNFPRRQFPHASSRQHLRQSRAAVTSSCFIPRYGGESWYLPPASFAWHCPMSRLSICRCGVGDTRT